MNVVKPKTRIKSLFRSFKARAYHNELKHVEKSPFWQDNSNALFASTAKSTFLVEGSRSGLEMKKFFRKKTLILAFEVIVQPPIYKFLLHYFSNFKAMCQDV